MIDERTVNAMIAAIARNERWRTAQAELKESRRYQRRRKRKAAPSKSGLSENINGDLTADEAYHKTDGGAETPQLFD